MSLSDPIADMLTRIRNANDAGHPTVEIPASREKQSIVDILVEEGYLESSEVIGEGIEKRIKATIRYGANANEKVISGVRRISKPGLRVYAGSEDLPQVLGGLGIAIVSTNKGIITEKHARKLGVGGEVLAYVW